MSGVADRHDDNDDDDDGPPPMEKIETAPPSLEEVIRDQDDDDDQPLIQEMSEAVLKDLDTNQPGAIYDPATGDVLTEQSSSKADPNVKYADDNMDEEERMQVSMLGDPHQDEEEIFIDDARVPYSIYWMDSTYGESHRGAVARQPMEDKDVIQIESATVYVSGTFDDPAIPQESRSFFERDDRSGGIPFYRVPRKMVSVRGAMWITLAGVMIRDHEVHAVRAINPDTGLHGRIREEWMVPVEEAYRLARKSFFSNDPEKEAFWTVDKFGRLMAILHLNAMQGFIPMTNRSYGIGFFPGSIYFNHSCTPNATLTMMPGKLYVQVLSLSLPFCTSHFF